MLIPRNCYVVERHDPQLAETKIEGVWSARTIAWEHVNDSLVAEKKELEDTISNHIELEIIESACADDRQAYYYLQDKDGNEFVGFYITEVEYHE